MVDVNIEGEGAKMAETTPGLANLRRREALAFARMAGLQSTLRQLKRDTVSTKESLTQDGASAGAVEHLRMVHDLLALAGRSLTLAAIADREYGE